MEILVFNGSPKGNNSVTVQTPLYWQRRYPQCHFTILPVAQRLTAYTKDMTPILQAVEQADVILFSYPIYTFLAPYQLHRFLELLQDSHVTFQGKYVAQMTTSKHFYDITAHAFLEAICYDLGGLYLGGFSSDMEDLLTPLGQTQADHFFQKLLFDIQHQIYKTKPPQQISPRPPYQSTASAVAKTGNRDVVIVTNAHPDDVGLHAMISDFQNALPHPTRIVNVREFPFKGGCLGCMECANSESCVYKDGFEDFLRGTVHTGDAIVYAFTIQHHFTHSSMKCYDDRQFCNGHRTTTAGMPVAYLIQGDYANEPNLQTLVEARSQVGKLYLAGVATDEENPPFTISQLAQSLDYALTHSMDLPCNFYGVGGTKIFRDLVYEMQGFMRADHKFYKEHGIYDFPHNKRGKILQMKALGCLMTLPSVQKKMKGQLSKYILAPYTKVVDGATPIEESK